MIKVLITAPKGHMGSLLVRAASQDANLLIVGGIGPRGREYIGEDIGRVAGLQNSLNAKVFDDIYAIIEECDVIIDFSTVPLSLEVLEAAVRYNKPLICGTTGFTEEENEIMRNAAKKIPFLKAANTSFVVNVMNKLLVEATRALKDMADIEIIEMHSAGKKDAPSGTALEMGHLIESTAAEKGKVAYHSVRAGDIPSSHTVLFGCMGERLEISHHAYNWNCYAEGACRAIGYIYKQSPGLYGMEDVVSDK